MTLPSSNNPSKLRDLGFIFFRNFFLLTNAIIFSVVALLFILGAIKAAIFLGVISVINISLGLIQDIHAWRALDKLQSLTAPRVTRRTPDGKTEIILTDHTNKNDIIVLKIGDQIPGDGTLIEADALEINEGLITGESNSISKKIGDSLSAGGVITSGSGALRVATIPQDSRIARMTAGIKKYSLHTSPIQHSVTDIIKISGYVLGAVLLIVIARGVIAHQTAVYTALNVAALTSIIVPQGLVFAVSLFFAYGAAHLFKQHVLLQEINATEKLGRVKNLCLDKTGTLTDNILAVEDMHLAPDITKETARELTNAYLSGTKDSSRTVLAIKKFLGGEFKSASGDTLAFSSSRQYGAVALKIGSAASGVFLGAPDVFLPHIKDTTAQSWLADLQTTHTLEGKSLVAIARAESSADLAKLEGSSLSVIAVFVFFNNLRPGITDTIKFFQDRGVRLRVISGDNLATVSAVAKATGVNQTTASITGPQLITWSDTDFDKNVNRYTIFAQIIPEQKAKIIAAFKKDGFTAMVGDGANDALAIKKADLGIAMFDGAPATRQLAAVVLTNNSFTALPGGVTLADSIIRNIEIFASVFLNQSFLGFFFFCFITLGGYAFPLTPFNITLINYCTVAIPGVLISYWTIRPSDRATRVSEQPFLKRIIPFALCASIIQALAAAAVFMLSQIYGSATQSGTLVLLAFSALGFIFFTLTPRVFNGFTSTAQIKQLALFGLIDIVLLLIAFRVPFLFAFFNLSTLSISLYFGGLLILIVGLAGGLLYLLARYFTSRIKKISLKLANSK